MIDLRQIETLPGGIPKLAHCYWSGSALPKTFRLLLDRFRALHPGWHVKVWSDRTLPPLLNHREYQGIAQLAWKADVVRYDLVAQFGGVWMDLDIVWMKCLDDLLDGCEAFGGREAHHPHWVNNAIFGARRGHPWAWALVSDLHESYESKKHRHRNPLPSQVGVPYFNEVLKRFKSRVTVFPSGIFHPHQYEMLANADLTKHPTCWGLHFYSSASTTGKVQNAIDAGRISIPPPAEAARGATLQIDADSM